MKFLLSILCLSLLSCSTPAPEPKVTSGRFVILEFSAPGKVVRSYEVESFVETEFPRTVTFSFNGRTVTLSGSYQINEFLK